MSKQFAILHLEDNSTDAELIGRELLRGFPGATIHHVDSSDAFRKALSTRTFDIILSDYSLPSFNGLEALKIARQTAPDVPYIFVSGAIGEDRAIDSLKNGATDYVLKDRLARLVPAVQRALSESEDRRRRFQLENTAKESEILYKTLIETSPDAIVLTDLDKRITMVNGQMIDLFGGSAVEDLVGRNAMELIDPEDHPRAEEHATQTLQQGGIRNVEYNLLRKNGSRYPAEIDAALIRDGQGNPKAFVAIVKDITERKKVLTALVESENRYRNLIETSADAIVLSDLEGTILFCNQQTADFLGFETARSLIGKSVYEFVDPEHHPLVRETGSRIRATGQVRNFEYRLFKKDGTPALVEVSSSLIRTRDGTPRAFTSFLRDITERRRNEEKILEQAALLDVDPAAIQVRDLDDRIQFWNRGAERLYGWSKDEVLGARSTDFLPEDSAKEFSAAKVQLLKTGRWRGEASRRRKDGSSVDIESQWILVRDRNGTPKSVYVVDVDITEKKILQNQILRAQRLESIGTLAGGIAHDLNNVLGPILLSLQILQKKLTEAQDVKMLEMLEMSARRGATMIRQVLTFARGIEGERIPISLHHLVKEIQDIANQTFPKSIGFRTSVARGLWNITGDATQLHQVLLNLCVNARDAMPEGGTITVEATNVNLDRSYAQMHTEAAPGPYVSLSVVDTGSGIPPELMDRIFEPFFTTKETGKGSGLGLSTTLGIIKSHRGFINVYSEPNKGSKFTIYLPAQPEAKDELRQGGLAELPRGNGELILVADDESTIVEITKATLEAYGYSVLTASDGTEAISQEASNPGKISLVICDMNMPYMDGLATIRALRKMDPRLKFVAVSGLLSNAKSPEFEDPASTVTLQKPFTAEKLLTVIHKLLSAQQ